jgi:ParB family chromosome partitioning protein
MSAKTSKGLGKGLGSLLGEVAVEAVETENAGQTGAEQKEDSGVRKLRIIDIEPNASQPRRDFDEERLGELADSIARNGLLQPVAVRRMDGGTYQIIAGERRWRAARMAGLKEIPAIILEADDLKAMELAMIENLQREDLNPVEEAEGYRKLVAMYGLTQEEVAERVGKSRPVIANAVRLLFLDSGVLEMLRLGRISAGHARSLLSLPSAADQKMIADRICDQGLSVRQTEILVKKVLEIVKDKEDEEDKKQVKGITVNYLEVLQKDLGEKLGRKIKIVNGKSKGRIEIEYYGSEDLNNLTEFLSGIKR